MSTFTNTIHEPRRTGWIKWLVLTLVLAIPAFLLSPNGPLGSFWRPAAGTPTPYGIQMALFMLLNIAEVLTFGLGVSFLIFGYPIAQRILPRSKNLATAAYLSVAWLLINWWPHDSLHIHVGESNLGQLLSIEYGFHITLMIAGAILAYFFFELARERGAIRD